MIMLKNNVSSFHILTCTGSGPGYSCLSPSKPCGSQANGLIAMRRGIFSPGCALLAANISTLPILQKRKRFRVFRLFHSFEAIQLATERWCGGGELSARFTCTQASCIGSRAV